MSSKLAQFLGMAEKVVRQQAVQTFLPDVPYHGRVSSNPHLYSSMADVTSFAVPACQDPQANIAGVVSISRAHLDAVPESLLSIAALQSSAGEVVRLSSWAKPNVAVLQVVADCILKSGQKREPVCPDEVIQALDYFNIPETLWPEGLIAASAVSQKYDIAACAIMDTIKGKVMAMAKNKFTFDRTHKYFVYRNSETRPFKPESALGVHTDFRKLLLSQQALQLPEPLKERIQALADQAFLQIQFNPDPHSDVSCPLASSWSFIIKVHSLSSEKVLNARRKVASVHQ